MAKTEVEQFNSEGYTTELKIDAVANGDLLVEVRSPMSIIVHTLSQTEAINLMEWLSRATA